MKKLFKFSTLALLAIPAIVGCNGKNNGKNYEAQAKTAIAQVGVSYSSFAGTDGISLAGTKLITEYEVEGISFTFAYSVAPIGNAYEIEYLKVDTEKSRLVVEIPTFAELEAQGFAGATYAAYKLSAEVSHDGKKAADASWNIRINAEEVKPVWQKISEARLKESGATVVTTGYVTAVMNNADDAEYQNGVWVADGADGMMLYGASLTAYFTSLHIGDMILVIGQASPYNGLFEVKNPSISFVDESPEAIAQPVWTEIGETELNSYDAVKANDPVTIPNATIVSDMSGKTAAANTAISIDVKVGGKTITYYLNKHTNTAQRQAVIDAINANSGKTVTIKSVLGWNASKLQITGCVVLEGGGLVDSLTFSA